MTMSQSTQIKIKDLWKNFPLRYDNNSVREHFSCEYKKISNLEAPKESFNKYIQLYFCYNELQIGNLKGAI